MAAKGRKPKTEPTMVESFDEKTDGQSMNEETAGQAIATITANIAATQISVPNIDNQPIIEEERVPEDTTTLVNFVH